MFRKYIGYKCKIKKYGPTGDVKTRKIGKIIAATEHLIVVEFGRYRESFNFAEIIASGTEVKVKIEDDWVGLKGLYLNERALD